MSTDNEFTPTDLRALLATAAIGLRKSGLPLDPGYMKMVDAAVAGAPVPSPEGPVGMSENVGILPGGFFAELLASEREKS